jgi:hypothetical protein
MSKFTLKTVLMRSLAVALAIAGLNVILHWGVFGEFGKYVLGATMVITYLSYLYLRPTERDRAQHQQRKSQSIQK